MVTAKVQMITDAVIKSLHCLLFIIFRYGDDASTALRQLQFKLIR
jgi:hypothetical protein